MSFTSAAIRFNRVTWVVLFFVAVGGYMAYARASRAEDPGFPIRTAMVQTFFVGASPERVEKLVTDKIEKSIQQMPELDFVQSISKTGVSTIFVNIKESYKKHELRPIWDSLRRKVDSARRELPQGVAGPFVNDEFGDVFGIVLGITGDGFSDAELKEVADEVRDELLELQESAKVELYGAQEERIFLEFKNERLAELGSSPSQLQAALASQNIVIPGGKIKSGSERYVLEPTGNFESVEDIGKTVLHLPGRSEVLRLSDLAVISRGYVEPKEQEFHDSGTPGLALAVSLRDGGNISNLGEQVRAKITELQERYPIGIEFHLLLFQPQDVAKLVNNFTSSLLQAVLIVVLAMVIFLGIKTGLVVASLIPMAIAAALLVMGMFGIGLDQMSLASLIIALGMLVDNAVVMAESTVVQMSEGKGRIEAAVDSAKELRIPLLISSLTTCVAFLPIFLAESSTGEYTAPLFKVVTITLLCSWALSLTLTPLMCSTFLKPPKTRTEQPFETRFYRIYRGFVIIALKNRVATLAITAAIFLGCMQLFGLIPNIFFPSSDNPSFVVKMEMPAGTAIEATTEAAGKLEKFMTDELEVKDENGKGVTHWATFVGEAGPRFYLSYNPDPPTPELAVLVASATDRHAAEQAVRRVRDFILEEIPDAVATVEPRALGPPSTAPVMFGISGKDQEEVFHIVDDVKAELRKAPGAVNIRDDWGQRVKKLEIIIDRDRALRAGVSNQDVAISLQTALTGVEVTQYREDENVIPVIMRSTAADRGDLGKIDALSVFSQSTGRSVPLKAIADTKVVWEPSVIRRRDRRQTVNVMANLAGDVTAADINAQIIPWLDQQAKSWEVGYRWRMGGEMEQAEKGNKSINDKMPIAMFLISMLLVLQFNSIRRPLIILLTIPLAMIGVGIGLFVFNSYFGFMTLLGVISLFGIVINNAIVLIDRIDIEITEFKRPPADAVVVAAQRRLRPILLTTGTTVLGLLPLWFGGGPMWQPMAISIIFGLMFATLLTLVFVPILYSLFFRVSFKSFKYDPRSVADPGS